MATSSSYPEYPIKYFLYLEQRDETGKLISHTGYYMDPDNRMRKDVFECEKCSYTADRQLVPEAEAKQFLRYWVTQHHQSSRKALCLALLSTSHTRD